MPKKILKGIVVSDKPNKSITVIVNGWGLSEEKYKAILARNVIVSSSAARPISWDGIAALYITTPKRKEIGISTFKRVMELDLFINQPTLFSFSILIMVSVPKKVLKLTFLLKTLLVY